MSEATDNAHATVLAMASELGVSPAALSKALTGWRIERLAAGNRARDFAPEGDEPKPMPHSPRTEFPGYGPLS